MRPCPACGAITVQGSQFCSRCGVVVGSALTGTPALPPTAIAIDLGKTVPIPSFLGVNSPPGAISMGSAEASRARRGSASIVRGLGLFAAGAAVAGGVAALYLRPGTNVKERQPPTATVSTPRGGADRPGVPEQRREPAPPPIPIRQSPPPDFNFGMPTVHFRSSVDAAPAATGSPDGAFAVVRVGVITLQMPTGQQLISDGTPAADLRVAVDPTRPGPYRVEIGVGHNVFIPVAALVTGSADIDLDAAGVRIGRFVRVSTRALGTEVALDAVLVRVPATTGG